MRFNGHHRWNEQLDGCSFRLLRKFVIDILGRFMMWISNWVCHPIPIIIILRRSISNAALRTVERVQSIDVATARIVASRILLVSALPLKKGETGLQIPHETGINARTPFSICFIVIPQLSSFPAYKDPGENLKSIASSSSPTSFTPLFLSHAHARRQSFALHSPWSGLPRMDCLPLHEVWYQDDSHSYCMILFPQLKGFDWLFL